MAENFEQNKIHNAELLEEALFALQQRTEPNIVLMSASDYGLQRKIVARLKAKLPEYQFYDIDLTPFKVVSLHKALREHLPAQVLNSPPITYCVNVFGLENSRLASEDGKIIDSGMIAQLNFEREVVFRKPNYLTILWGDHDFFVQLQRQAPDFWSWVTYYFEFQQEEAYEEVVFEKESVPEFSAKLPEREEYIKSLEAKLNHLPLNDSDKSRITQERLNLYNLLAREYANSNDYDKSEKYFANALQIYNLLHIEGYDVDKLLFDYAALNFKFRHFKEALVLYNKNLTNALNQADKVNIGNIYHQVGNIYKERHAWDQALENYRLALKWKLQTGQEDSIGRTYHNIGVVYQGQYSWNKAMENYRLALNWKQKTGKENEISRTYHQIGNLYQEQRALDQAIENYDLALKWNQATGQEHKDYITIAAMLIIHEERMQQRGWID